MFGTTDTAVGFNATDFSTPDLVGPANGVLGVAPRDGLYNLAGVLTAFGTSGAIVGSVSINGVAEDDFYQRYLNQGWDEIGFNHLTALSAGDVVTVEVRHTSGSGEIASNEYTHASMRYVGPSSAANQPFVRRTLTGGNQTLDYNYSAVAFATTDLAGGGMSAPSNGVLAVAASDGVYEIAGALTAGFGNQITIDGYIAINGVIHDRFYEQESVSQIEEIGYHTLANLEAGDVVTLHARGNGGTLYADYSAGHVRRVAAVEDGADHVMQRRLSVTQNVSSSGAFVNFDVTDLASDHLTTPASGVLGVASVEGLYAIAGSLTVDPAGTVASGYVTVNGDIIDRFYAADTVMPGAWEEIPITTLAYLLEGDVVGVYINQSASIAGGDYTVMNMTLVPEPGVGLLVAIAMSAIVSRCRRGAARAECPGEIG